jgi:hypothetical protein
MVEAANAHCVAADYLELARRAVDLHQRNPSDDERIATAMTSLWLAHSKNWNEAAAEEIGQLFADLDVPVEHVGEGAPGAQTRWSRIEILARDNVKRAAHRGPPSSNAF